MASMRDRIRSNLDTIHSRIARAAERAGRDAGDVRLVAVTKSVGVDEVRALVDLGLADLGENRVEVAREKIQAVGNAVRWHMVGNIQRRKVRDVVALFDRVDAVDRLALAEALDKRCGSAGRTLPVLVEVNVSGEEAKHGFGPRPLHEAVAAIRELDHVKVEGLMTMAPFTENPEEARPLFATLRSLAEDLGLPVLSMGMTNDFEIAVEEGATEIRIGTALFK